jgi:tRNA modification GTPase
VSSRYLARAAVVLACSDDAARVDDVSGRVGASTTAPVLGVLTKSDLVTDREQIRAAIPVSSRTGEGLAALLDAIDHRLAAAHGVPGHELPGLTRARHRAAVARAIEELEAFREAWERGGIPTSIAAIHVRHAADALGELIGAIRTDDVLDVVFRQFCVGK